MDAFYCERELCEHFKSKIRNFTITFNINSQEVTIYVRHFEEWNSQKGKVILDTSGKTLRYH